LVDSRLQSPWRIARTLGNSSVRGPAITTVVVRCRANEGRSWSRSPLSNGPLARKEQLMMDFLGNTWTIVGMIVVLLGLIAALLIVRNKKSEDD
jgi:hypothetical protein